MALRKGARVKHSRARCRPVVWPHIEEGSWDKSRFDPRFYWFGVTENALAMAYAVPGRRAGFPVRSGYSVEIDSEPDEDNLGIMTPPTATERERARSRTVGARTAKLPAESYQKLLNIVRNSEPGTSDIE